MFPLPAVKDLFEANKNKNDKIKHVIVNELFHSLIPLHVSGRTNLILIYLYRIVEQPNIEQPNIILNI